MAGCSAASIDEADIPLADPDSSDPRPAGSPAEREPAGRLAAVIGYQFVRPELLTEALTHPSALPPPQRRRTRPRPSAARGYERLEFLGDRVLGLVIADLLWRRFATEPEGPLTRRYASLVRGATLTRVAEAIGLGSYLMLSPAEASAGGAANPGILADSCEALIAAIYLDGGLPAAAAFVLRWWGPLLGEMAGPPSDPKTALQEWAQARGLALPVYELTAASGPDHALRFTVSASVAGCEPAVATASSKRLAEAKAAAALLDSLAGEPLSATR